MNGTEETPENPLGPSVLPGQAATLCTGTRSTLLKRPYPWTNGQSSTQLRAELKGSASFTRALVGSRHHPRGSNTVDKVSVYGGPEPTEPLTVHNAFRRRAYTSQIPRPRQLPVIPIRSCRTRQKTHKALRMDVRNRGNFTIPGSDEIGNGAKAMLLEPR